LDRNAPEPNVVTDAGITSDLKELPLKATGPIAFKESGSETELILFSANASSPI